MRGCNLEKKRIETRNLRPFLLNSYLDEAMESKYWKTIATVQKQRIKLLRIADVVILAETKNELEKLMNFIHYWEGNLEVKHLKIKIMKCDWEN